MSRAALDDLWGVAPTPLREWRLAALQVPDGGELSGVVDALGVSEIPSTLDELNRAQNRSDDLSLSAAAELGIPVAGSVSGGGSQRVVVLERAAYKQIELPDDAGSEQWGYAIRFCITISKFDASLKITLPFLAASAQMGRIEAQWTLQVVGLAGPKIDEQSLPPTDLNVETFVLAKQSLESLIASVRDPSTQFNAVRLATKSSETARLDQYRRAIGVVLALDGISEGTAMEKLVARLSDGRVVDSVRDTYREITDGGPMTSAQRQMAEHLLGRIRIQP